MLLLLDYTRKISLISLILRYFFSAETSCNFFCLLYNFFSFADELAAGEQFVEHEEHEQSVPFHKHSRVQLTQPLAIPIQREWHFAEFRWL